MADTLTAYYSLTKPALDSTGWGTNVNDNFDTIDSLLEGVEDRVHDLIQNGTGISWTYDDDAGTLTPTVTLSLVDTDSLGEGSTNLYYTDERVDDRVNALIVAGTGITGTYDDAAGTYTIDLGALTGNWDAGAYEIRALTFESDQATGTAPLAVASTTMVDNFNAALLDGNEASAFALLALSNLASVAINTSLISDADNTDDLGSATKGWQDLYFSDATTGAPSTNGQIRYNATNTQFEFYENGAVHTLAQYDPIAFAAPGTLAAGDKAPWGPPMKGAGTIIGATAVLKTVSTVGAVTLDILKSTDNGANWTTIFSTKITIDQDERSTATAATPSVLNVTTYAANNLFRINIDAAGSGAADATVCLWLEENLV